MFRSGLPVTKRIVLHPSVHLIPVVFDPILLGATLEWHGTRTILIEVEYTAWNVQERTLIKTMISTLIFLVILISKK